MFHWICPECGREIAPQAKECAVCDPLAAAAAEGSAAPSPEPLLLAEPARLGEPAKDVVETVESAPKVVEAKSKVKPEPKTAGKAEAKVETPIQPKLEKPKAEAKIAPMVEAKPPAPLQPAVPGSPKPPASAVPLPVPTAGRDITPVATAQAPAQAPAWKQALPEPEPARAPRIAGAPLREPQPATLATLSSKNSDLAAGPEFTPSPASLPSLSAADPGPRLAPLTDSVRNAAARIAPAKGNTKPAASAVVEHISLPGPTLPHELTSLQAAGIAKILVAGQQQAAVQRSSSWLLSFTVAAAVLAATLSAVFYAMPGLANSSAPPKKVVAAKATKEAEPPEPPAPTNPLAKVVEVTGIRFVTDVPGQSPQIHYLVVNHGNLPLMGLTVNVTLRTAGTESDSPLSQFVFKASRLGPYESKEMVSSIERFNRPVTLPNWRDLRAEIQIAQ